MKADIVADIQPEDRHENISLMEPLLLGGDSRYREVLTDLALDLARKSDSFRSSLPPSVRAPLATLVRSMNCYYSNLIEGHATHPVDIERALKNDYSQDADKRDLQLEALAHINVQKWVDGGGLNPGEATSEWGIREIHRRFCALLPEELLWVEDPASKDRVRVVPGELRGRYVQVGSHSAISPGAVPRFVRRFEEAYRLKGKTDSIIATAAAHHRLLWIHPFLDGNGRVARLMSHAMMLDLLDTGAIWSIARGLARNSGKYKELLAHCDRTRRNDLDGRGNLSEEALVAFTQFFLTTCIDQITFMQAIMQPDTLRTRILLWTEEEVRLGNLPTRSGNVLEAILYRGEIPRRDVETLVGVQDRQARRIVHALLTRGILSASGARAPLRLAFPAELAYRWMPGLFPEKPASR